MSFSGRYEVLCENGHRDTFSVYIDEPKDWSCSICGAQCVWWIIHDDTNEWAGYADLEKITETKMCTCPTCNHKHIAEQATYKIPERIGLKRIIKKKSIKVKYVRGPANNVYPYG